MKSYIKCVNVDYESARIEEFNGSLIYLFNGVYPQKKLTLRK